jgi:hypothetical protein
VQPLLRLDQSMWNSDWETRYHHTASLAAKEWPSDSRTDKEGIANHREVIAKLTKDLEEQVSLG